MKSARTHLWQTNARRLLALVALPGLLGLSASAQQSSNDKKDETVQLEAFAITGSRLSPPDFEGALPVTTFGSVELAKNTAQTLNNFLRFNPTTSGAGNIDEGTVNGSNGGAFTQLRGLATLTLVNGHRMATGDTNNIPLSAIDKIEILKDGNGAVYGDGAIGGVINIITKRKFDGVSVDASYQNTSKNDISRRRFELVFGNTWDRGNFAMGVSYFQQNDLFSRDRNELTNVNDKSFGATSGTPNPGKFNLSAAQALAMFGIVQTGTVSYRVKNTVTAAASPNDFRVGQYGNVPAAVSDRFPFSIFTPTVRPSDRYNYWTSLDYQLFKDSKAANFYADLRYMRNVSHAQLAPAPAGFRSTSADGNFTIPANYFWNRQVFGANAVDITSWDYRFLDLGPRDNKVTFTEFAFTGGLKGEINDRIGYDASYSWNRNEQYDEEQHGVNRANLLKVLQGTAGAQFTGANSFNPFTNPFDSGVVSNNAAVLRFIDFTPRTLRTTTTRVANATVNFRPVDLPAGQVQLLVGTEKRWETFVRDPDLAKLNATGSGFNGSAFLATEFSIQSYFAEVIVPVLKDAPFAKSMQLGFDARRESYSHFNDKPTILRAFVRNQVNKELTTRLSYSEGFAIPTPASLDPTVTQNFPSIFIPWLGGADQPQSGVLLSGNAALKPTTSKSYNAGIIWAPKALKGFELNVDFYKIEQKDIAIQDPQLLVDSFAAGGGVTAGPNGTFIKNNAAPFADRIVLDGDGSITGIKGNLVQVTGVKTENLSSLKATALDIDARYTYNTDTWGQFSLHTLITHTFKYDIDKIPGVLPTTHYAGFFTPNDSIGPGTQAKWKGTADLGWDYKNFFAFVKLNYTGSFKEDPAGGNAFTSTVGAWTTLDATLSYTYARTNTKLQLGVENLGNKLPPPAESAFADHYDRNSHNILGRLYSVSLHQKF